MKCPDCGQDLAEVTVTGFDKSFRCDNCGGFWMEGWVANRVAESQMNEFADVKPDVNKFVNKSNTCPTDSAPLFGYTGDDMPVEVNAFKCSHCGWWWFPANNLQKFKKAYEAKTNYQKYWAKRTQAAMMVLPILMMLLLIVGLGASVVSISRQQKTQVQASLGPDNFRADYMGKGSEQIRFKSDKDLQRVLFKRLESDVWGPVDVLKQANGEYLVVLSDLKDHEVYQIQVGDKRYYFQTQ